MLLAANRDVDRLYHRFLLVIEDVRVTEALHWLAHSTFRLELMFTSTGIMYNAAPIFDPACVGNFYNESISTMACDQLIRKQIAKSLRQPLLHSFGNLRSACR